MSTRRRTTRKAVTKGAMVNEFKGVGLMAVGVVAASLGGSMIDKMLKVDHTDTRMNLKKFVRPLALLIGGAAGSIALPDENMRNICKGVAMSGVLSTVKVVLRKDLLSGLDSFTGIEGLGEIGDYDAYGEPIGNLENAEVYYEPEAMAMLPMGTAESDEILGYEMGSYDPILPELSAVPLSYSDAEEAQIISYTPNVGSLEAVEVDEII